MFITKFIAENKDKISSIFALLMALYVPVNSYFANESFQVSTFILMLMGAVVSYSIGKYPANMVAKTHLTSTNQKKAEESGVVSTDMVK